MRDRSRVMPTVRSNGLRTVIKSVLLMKQLIKLLTLPVTMILNNRSREMFSFHRPETLKALAEQKNTIRNNLKNSPRLMKRDFASVRLML